MNGVLHCGRRAVHLAYGRVPGAPCRAEPQRRAGRADLSVRLSVCLSAARLTPWLEPGGAPLQASRPAKRSHARTRETHTPPRTRTHTPAASWLMVSPGRTYSTVALGKAPNRSSKLDYRLLLRTRQGDQKLGRPALKFPHTHPPNQNSGSLGRASGVPRNRPRTYGAKKAHKTGSKPTG